MSSFNGRKLKIEIFGSSHSEKIGVKVSGFPDFKVDFKELYAFTERRKAKNAVYSTTRKESDEPVFSGIDGDRIRGDFTAEIINSDVKRQDYSSLYGKPRPSHADYAWYLKDGVLDFSGGGRFSGRMTAPLCVIGGICKQFLKEKGIFLAVQCCEHLNRAIVTERAAVPNAEIVNVVPQKKAGGSLATVAYGEFENPVVLEEIKADAGIDIGGTLIGMHLKKVAVPVRIETNKIGKANVVCARVRPRFIGGIRAIYDENLL